MMMTMYLMLLAAVGVGFGSGDGFGDAGELELQPARNAQAVTIMQSMSGGREKRGTEESPLQSLLIAVRHRCGHSEPQKVPSFKRALRETV